MNTTNTKETIEPKEKQKATQFLGDLDLRDYFAAKVLAGAMVSARGLDELDNGTLISVAEQCYRMADAMLEARDK